MSDEQWMQGQWHGKEKWTCLICQWDTLKGLDAAREHEAGCLRCHPPANEAQPSPILVADKRGNIKPGGIQ